MKAAYLYLFPIKNAYSSFWMKETTQSLRQILIVNMIYKIHLARMIPDLAVEKGPVVLSKQITLCQKATSHARGLVNSVKILLRYRKAYRNYLSVLKHIIQKRYPTEAVLKNGQEITLRGFEVSYNIARLHDQTHARYNIIDDMVLISDPTFTNSNDLKLKGGLYNGEVVNIFLDNVYRNFPVKGKIVLDLGANIADSCIYFALRGAERVIGVEPLLKNYEMAEENINLNNYSNKITVILAGCSVQNGSVNIDADLEKGIGRQIRGGANRGGAVPLLTLEQILQQNNVGEGETVLKMDCEGCEYDVILSASDDLLRRFSNILIEYHYGYKHLKERLIKCNFDVSLVNVMGQPGGPTAVPDPDRLGHWYYMGYIYANRERRN